MATKSSKHLVLTEEGIRGLNTTLGNFVLDSGAKAVLLIDKSGQMIAAQGETSSFDTMSISALITGSFNSTKAIATLLGETEFKTMFQQGHSSSIYMVALSSQDVLGVIFPNQITVGRIKYKLDQVVGPVDQQLQVMYQQSPTTSPIRPAQAPAPKINDLF
ncbi:MAG TPA: roadblock/LC7 domain-containing protein [Stenomitos sp.]